MWQICKNLLTKKVEVWLLFVNLPTCTHPSVAQAGPSWFWSDPVHWYNNNLTSHTHLLPNPTSANNLHSHKLQLPRHPPLNQSTAIHKSNITIALNPTTTRHQPRNPKTAKAENRSSFSSNFTYFLPHFGPRLAHPGRPWLRHWLTAARHRNNRICGMP